MRHFSRDVCLFDADEKIVGTWKYLIKSSPSEILRLPLLSVDESVDDLKIPQEARWLIGWWLNKGASSPCKRHSAWSRSGTHVTSYWGEAIRERIASQVKYIKHWRAYQAVFPNIPYGQVDTTYFVDPPYKRAGKSYTHGSSGIDFTYLGEWCKQRASEGNHIIVCEEHGADWLPFKEHGVKKATSGRGRLGVCKEVVWHN